MFQPLFKTHFLKKEAKLTKNNPNLKKLINQTLILLLENPQNPRLKSHKVYDSQGNRAFSSSVNTDIRLIWDYHSDTPRILDILDIGGHSGKQKVYL